MALEKGQFDIFNVLKMEINEPYKLATGSYTSTLYITQENGDTVEIALFTHNRNRLKIGSAE